MTGVTDRDDAGEAEYPAPRGPVAVPPELLRFEHRPDGWYDWRDHLPALVRDVFEEWGLEPDGFVASGECSLVLGVLAAGAPAVVKFGWPHQESRHEHLALRAWSGQGAVRLLRADPARSVLLLERASPVDLTSVPIERALEVTASLYSRLHRPAHPQLDLLSAQAARWSAELRALPSSAPVPHRLVEQAAHLAAGFATDRAADGTLIHTDLHYANVLAAQREPWLAIDPKPLSGDPCYEVAPLLWNRWDDLGRGSGVRGELRRRLDIVTSAAGLDPDRARDWTIVRELVNAKDTLTTAPHLGAAEHDWITRCVTVAKAVQD
jgi:streptomycin 6-kinase